MVVANNLHCGSYRTAAAGGILHAFKLAGVPEPIAESALIMAPVMHPLSLQVIFTISHIYYYITMFPRYCTITTITNYTILYYSIAISLCFYMDIVILRCYCIT